MHHPWRELSNLKHINVHWRLLPEGLRGASDGDAQIWMDKRLLQVERRCTLTHELVHLELEHDGCQDAKAEAAVRRISAERLITPDQLLPVLHWARSVEEAADELWVTPEVFLDRVTYMAPAERALTIVALYQSKEHYAD